MADVPATFSPRRYFVHNVDSYHAAYILRELAALVARPETRPSSPERGGEDADDAPTPPEEPYEIIGTVSDPTIEKVEWVTRLVPRAAAAADLLGCGHLVLDITGEAEDVAFTAEFLKVLKKLFDKLSAAAGGAGGGAGGAGGGDGGSGGGDEPGPVRHLVLLSTVLTWGATKPLDPDNPEVSFVESDFRKRRPAPAYRAHYDVEAQVVDLARHYKKYIKALVVCAGAAYGGREAALAPWFQRAWEAAPTLPLLGRGDNFVPLIHVADLAQLVYIILTDFPKKLYVLAVEPNPTRQREIIKPLGRAAGTGLFQCVPPLDAFLVKEIGQRTYDLLTLNLSMEPALAADAGVRWTCESGFAEAVPALMKEYKKERGLRPFKVLVHGPPLVGKTTLARRLCRDYGLLYVAPHTAVQDLVQDLTFRLRHWEGGETCLLGPAPEDLEPEDDDVTEEQEAARQTLAALQAGRAPTDDEMIGYIRQRLLSPAALNRGYVLDGYPATLQQCQALFSRGEETAGAGAGAAEAEEDAEGQFEEDVTLYDNVLRKILPDVVVCLVATDEFISDKAMSQLVPAARGPAGDRPGDLPGDLPGGLPGDLPGDLDSRFDEETVMKRLMEYRVNDLDEFTPMNFFDEIDIHPLVVRVDDHGDYDMKGPYHEVTLRMGRACRYDALREHIEAAELSARRSEDRLRAREDRARAELELKMKTEREEKMEYWSQLYSLLQEEEEAALAAAAAPARGYLAAHVLPALVRALLEVARLRPKDPVDYLAEHLFRENPTGRMLEPGYNLRAERLLSRVRLLDAALLDLDLEMDLEPDLQTDEPAGPAAPAPRPLNPCEQMLAEHAAPAPAPAGRPSARTSAARPSAARSSAAGRTARM